MDIAMDVSKLHCDEKPCPWPVEPLSLIEARKPLCVWHLRALYLEPEMFARHDCALTAEACIQGSGVVSGPVYGALQHAYKRCGTRQERSLMVRKLAERSGVNIKTLHSVACREGWTRGVRELV
jgi:hypothetical protein